MVDLVLLSKFFIKMQQRSCESELRFRKEKLHQRCKEKKFRACNLTHVVRTKRISASLVLCGAINPTEFKSSI
jgi:hypothetical protein